jgi:zinc transporter ZupT
MIGFVAAFLLILFKRFSSEYYFHILIQILFAFSCGALIGEVMLHILPEAYRSKHTT